MQISMSHTWDKMNFFMVLKKTITTNPSQKKVSNMNNSTLCNEVISMKL